MQLIGNWFEESAATIVSNHEFWEELFGRPIAAVEVEEVAETLFKAVGELEAEQFDAVVEVVKNLNAKVEKQGFFEEQGSAAEGQQDQNVSPVAKALRTRLTKTEQ